MLYTDPWTGNTNYCHPTGYLDSYPVGYFGDTANARFDYLSPSARVDILKFRASQKRESLPRLRGVDIEIVKEDIRLLECRIELLQTKEYRLTEIERLLEHRASYIHKLTPRDRALIEAEHRDFQREFSLIQRQK